MVDIAGPVPLIVEGARLAALAAASPPPAHEDPDVRAAVAEIIDDFTLEPGAPDTDLEIAFSPAGQAHAAAVANQLPPASSPACAASASASPISQRKIKTFMSKGRVIASDRTPRQTSLRAAAQGAGPRRGQGATVEPGGTTADGRVSIMFRWLTAGESHGRALAAICDGVPAGVRVTSEDVALALARRGGLRPRRADGVQQDEVVLTGGVRHGLTSAGRSRSGREHRVAQVGDGHVARPGDAGKTWTARPATRR